MKERLLELTNNSSSPYYHYPVAAILECKDGKLFEGVNVETSSPAAGICAERNALYSAITAGYKKGDFKAIHLIAKSLEVIYPCFICRQTLFDYCDKDMEIISYGENDVVKTTVHELCVKGFGDENLV